MKCFDKKLCPFCDIDFSDICNTIIEETDNFIITPSKGSFVVGYLLIFPKKHIMSLNELDAILLDEL